MDGHESSPRRAMEGRDPTQNGESVDVGKGKGEENPPFPPPPSPPPSSPWCHHRADVRLANFKMRTKKSVPCGASLGGSSMRQPQPQPQQVPLSTGGGGGGATPEEERAQEKVEDTDMTIGADVLEILVASPPAVDLDGPSVAQRRDRLATKNPHKVRSLCELLQPETAFGDATAASSSPGTAASQSQWRRRNTWSGMPGKRSGGGGRSDVGGGGRGGGSSVHLHKPRAKETNGLTGETVEMKVEGEQRNVDDDAGFAGVEVDMVSGDDNDGHRMSMARVIAINSFRFRRSLAWSSPPRQPGQQPSSPDLTRSSSCSRDQAKDSGTEDGQRRDPDDDGGIVGESCAERANDCGVDMGVVPGTTFFDVGEKEEDGSTRSAWHSPYHRRKGPKGENAGRSRPPRLWSQMGIDVRAGHVAISLPPHLQLGDLQIAAILQWKGIQEALGVCRRARARGGG